MAIRLNPEFLQQLRVPDDLQPMYLATFVLDDFKATPGTGTFCAPFYDEDGDKIFSESLRNDEAGRLFRAQAQELHALVSASLQEGTPRWRPSSGGRLVAPWNEAEGRVFTYESRDRRTLRCAAPRSDRPLAERDWIVSIGKRVPAGFGTGMKGFQQNVIVHPDGRVETHSYELTFEGTFVQSAFEALGLKKTSWMPAGVGIADAVRASGQYAMEMRHELLDGERLRGESASPIVLGVSEGHLTPPKKIPYTPNYAIWGFNDDGEDLLFSISAERGHEPPDESFDFLDIQLFRPQAHAPLMPLHPLLSRAYDWAHDS